MSFFTKKNILLVVVLILIVGTIVIIERHKPAAIPSHAITAAQFGNSTSSATSATATSSLSAVSSSSAPFSSAQVAAARSDASDIANGDQLAIEFADPTGFINTQPFNLQDLIGKKVILLDFWTYSCINCIRTLPYLEGWYQKYENAGLVVIGVHTPEFDFEKNINNVQAAVKQLGVTYPVVLDSNMGTWNAYNNEYWPEEYLIDIHGYIVHQQIGEGSYNDTETEIQNLLKQRAMALDENVQIPTGFVTPNTAGQNLNEIGSPETYFGAARNEYLTNGTQGQVGDQTLTLPTASLQLNALYLSGTWNFQDQYAQNVSSGAQILYQYDSKSVYMVAAAATPVTFTITRDGKPLGTAAGSDVKVVNGQSTVTVQANRLYNLIDDPNGYGTHTLEITVHSPGLQAYTFTFG